MELLSELKNESNFNFIYLIEFRNNFILFFDFLLRYSVKLGYCKGSHNSRDSHNFITVIENLFQKRSAFCNNKIVTLAYTFNIFTEISISRNVK